MTHLAMNELTTYRWSFEEDVQHYAEAGFAAIGVWRHKLSDFGEERGADLLREHGLAVSSLLWAGGFTGSDGHSHKESIEDALDAVKMAAHLQAPTLIVHTGARAGHTHNHARRLVKTALVEVSRLAEDLGVSLGLEPMHAGCAADWTFLTSLDEARQLLADVGSRAVKLVVDTYHLCQEALPDLDCPELISQLALVQLGDGRLPPANGEQNRCRLGEGAIPLGEVVQRLIRGGYRGYWEIELLGEDVETTDYVELLRQSRHAAAAWFPPGRKIA
jgi:sugar phosphate isomerase/epimerase